jgi:hypothetical protein
MDKPHPNMKMILGICVVLSLFCSAKTTDARADVQNEEGSPDASQEKNERKPVDVKVRLKHPFSSLFIWGSGEPDTVAYGISLGLDIKQLFAFEFGAEKSFFYSIEQMKNYRLTSRIGLMPTLVDNRRSDNKGSTFQLGGLLGYSYSYGVDDHEEYRESSEHYITLAGALDYTYWAATYFGICFRLLLDFNIPFLRKNLIDDEPYTSDELGLGFEIAFSFGLAF